MTTDAGIAPRRVIGFDFGTRKIGAAVGQETTRSATPLCTLVAVRGQPDWRRIDEIIDDWQPDRLVVGRPLQADGSAGSVARASDRFVTQLEKRCGLPVDTVDERLSSQEAETRLRATGKGRAAPRSGIDAMAACLILETWFSIGAVSDDFQR
jgi:putative Holliday junction resolvase